MFASDDERLDSLFRAYRDASPAPDASANFMPDLWHRIESRNRFTFSFRRMANALVTAAVALSVALGVYTSVARSTQGYSPLSYVEILDDADSSVDVTPDIVAPARLEISDQRPVN
jgi:hypothetical protein